MSKPRLFMLASMKWRFKCARQHTPALPLRLAGWGRRVPCGPELPLFFDVKSPQRSTSVRYDH